MASRFGIQPQLIDDTLYDAFGQRAGRRSISPRSTPTTSSRRSRPALQKDPKTLEQLYIRSPNTGADGAAERLRQMDDRAGRAAVDQPPGPVPGGDDQLQPRAGRGARAGDRGDPEGRAGPATAARRLQTDVPGQRAGVPGFADDRAVADPGRAGRRLHHPRRALRELHPSADDSLDAALGRLRRARDPDAVRLRVQPDRADRRHPADRHRQEERHHDGRLRHRRRARRASLDAPRRSARRR